MVYDCLEDERLVNEAIYEVWEPEEREKLFEELNDPFYREFFSRLGQPLIDCYDLVKQTVG